MRNLLLGLLLLATAAGAAPVEINQIDQFRDRGFEYLDIYTTGFSPAKGLLLENKLYIDFPDTAFSKAVKIMKKKSKRIANLEIVRKDQTTARLIITLNKAIDYDIVNVFGRNKTVIEISDRLDNILAYQFDWENKNVRKKGSPLKPVKFEALAAPSDISLKGKTIILDPGHGGDDPGAFSASGVPEKSLTLKTAQVAARLLREAGATVYLTRDEDRRSNLKDVVEFANKEKAGIFISIHYNSTNNSGISGTETYYYNPVSRTFAESMHEAIVRGLRRKDRGLHRVRFYTVKYTDMPSVLLEPAYLSNSDENNLANSASFREEVAESIVKGVKNYFRSKLR